MKLQKLIQLVRQPSALPTALIRRSGKRLSVFFADKAFFLQGQMDIHPESVWRKPEFIKLTNGFYPTRTSEASRSIEDLEPWDTTRRDMLVLIMRMIIEKNIPGDFAELGVYKGSTAKLIHKYAPERKLHLFDTFSGFSEKGTSREKDSTGDVISSKQFSDTNLETVSRYIKPNENVSFYQGYFPEALPDDFDSLNFALVHLDADLYDPTMSGLEMFYPRMSKGGVIIVHDYNAWAGARTAVDTFFSDKPEMPLPMPDKSGSVVIIKQ